MRNFLRKIRKADYETKQRWLVIGTALAMMLVVGLWIVYMRASVQGLEGKAEKIEKIEEIDSGGETGIVGTFVRGVRVIGGYISRIAGNVAEKINFGKTYHVEQSD